MSVVHIDQQAFKTLKELMEDEFGSLLTMFLQDSEENLNSIDTAILSKDLESLRMASHTIKGSASNVGVVHFSALAAELENQVKLKVGDFDSYSFLAQKLREEFHIIKTELMREAA